MIEPTTSRIGWIDATGGVSGDMLLGACLDAGAELAVVEDAIAALRLPEEIRVHAEPAVRSGLGGTRAVVAPEAGQVRRTLPDVRALLTRLPAELGEPATEVFRVLAEAEGRVHRMPVDQVHFHEVGALDSIADVVGVVAALSSLRLDRLMCSPIALGGGRARTEHGEIPIPGPAVLELLRAHDAPGHGGPVDLELATPTGVALLVVLADEFGPLPLLRPEGVGVGAGTRDPDDHANLTRLVLGTDAANAAPGGETAEVILEANVDDLDPRVWPSVLTELLETGASDAWLTPILMKKGRPAHTVSVLAPPERAPALEQVLFRSTTTIGLRHHPVRKRALPRETISVQVSGHRVRVKLARFEGAVVNAVPEYDDVVATAEALDRPVLEVLDAARAAADTWR